MNHLLLIGVVLGGTLILYALFLAIGFVGISKNRKAQGLIKESKE